MPTDRRWLAALVVLLTIAPSAMAEAPRRPNVLFLLADDHSDEAVGALGIIDVETPNLDRLASRGALFSRARNMGSWSGAVCVASRCMLITGRTLWDASRVYESAEDERLAGRFWPSFMKQAGYETYFTGKWHILADAEAAFDVSRNIRPGMPPERGEAQYDRPKAGERDPWDPSDPSFGGFWEGGTHWSEVTADDAISFLDLAKGRDAPFFMYVAFNAPHDPRQSPREVLDRYPIDRVAVPPSFLPEYPHKDAIGCGPGLRDERLAPFPRTEEAIRAHRREYYAIITHLDEQIGRVLDALDASGKADETLVVYTADHGLAVGHHGLLGKQNLYEHSMRVPFLVAGPGIEPGRTIDAPIDLQDIMPTTLDLAGVPIPDHVGFRSLVPLLYGSGDPPARRSTYGAYLDLQRSVIVDDHKLILYPEAGVARLYRLDDDPFETRDLIDDPTQADRARSLFAELLRLQHELGDGLDLRPTFGDRFGDAG